MERLVRIKERERRRREGLLYKKRRVRIGMGKSQKGGRLYQKSPKKERRK